MKATIPIDAERIAACCRKWKITGLALFGSVLRDDFRPESDVDVLGNFAPDTSWRFSDLIRMEEELQELLGRPVDLVQRTAVERSENYLRGNISSRTWSGCMWRDDAYPLDRVIAARRILRFSSEVDREAFMASELHQHAIARHLEIVGEGARKIFQDARDAHPEIPLSEIIGMRNRLVHEDFRVDLARVWDIVQDEVDRLPMNSHVGGKASGRPCQRRSTRGQETVSRRGAGP